MGPPAIGPSRQAAAYPTMAPPPPRSVPVPNAWTGPAARELAAARCCGVAASESRGLLDEPIRLLCGA